MNDSKVNYFVDLINEKYPLTSSQKYQLQEFLQKRGPRDKITLSFPKDHGRTLFQINHPEQIPSPWLNVDRTLNLPYNERV